MSSTSGIDIGFVAFSAVWGGLAERICVRAAAGELVVCGVVRGCVSWVSGTYTSVRCISARVCVSLKATVSPPPCKCVLLPSLRTLVYFLIWQEGIPTHAGLLIAHTTDPQLPSHLRTVGGVVR